MFCSGYPEAGRGTRYRLAAAGVPACLGQRLWEPKPLSLRADALLPARGFLPQPLLWGEPLPGPGSAPTVAGLESPGCGN